ncbi:hypothetical protein ABH935_005278 [Catenulispora sp. GAS73]
MPIGERTAHLQRRAVVAEQQRVRRGELAQPLPEPLDPPLRLGVPAQQVPLPKERLEHPRVVVIDVPPRRRRRPVVVPPVAEIPGLDALDILRAVSALDRNPDRLQERLDDRWEQQPVVVLPHPQPRVVRQPVGEPFAHRIRELIPYLLPAQRQPEGQVRGLHGRLRDPGVRPVLEADGTRPEPSARGIHGSGESSGVPLGVSERIAVSPAEPRTGDDEATRETFDAIADRPALRDRARRADQRPAAHRVLTCGQQPAVGLGFPVGAGGHGA